MCHVLLRVIVLHVCFVTILWIIDSQPPIWFQGLFKLFFRDFLHDTFSPTRCLIVLKFFIKFLSIPKFLVVPLAFIDSRIIFRVCIHDTNSFSTFCGNIFITYKHQRLSRPPSFDPCTYKFVRTLWNLQSDSSGIN